MKNIVCVFALGGVLFLAGCATVYYPDPTPALVEKGKGIYHVVEKGDTLWRIAQAYDVDVEQIAAVNRITNASAILKGQKIFIPGASSAVKIEPDKEDFKKDEFIWPMRGRILSYFGRGNEGFWQQGIRIKAESEEKIFAARQGRVVFADDLMGYGQMVIIDHRYGIMSVYGNNARLAVDVGDAVNKNDLIAISPPGEDSFLYFEIRRNGSAENPLFYLPKI